MSFKKFGAVLTMVLAGETIFMIPFLLPRVLRPQMLQAWGISNLDLGMAFTFYGISATLSYAFGGPFADRFHPKYLISGSLLLTGLGGFFLLLSPSAFLLISLYGFFGASTIFFFWSGLIRTANLLGKTSERATTMGFVEGGRGLLAALVSLTLLNLLSDKAHSSSLDLKYLILAVVLFTLLIALISWLILGASVTMSLRRQNHYRPLVS